MKRLVIYILLLGAVVAAPAKPLEVGKLRPVQVVSIYKEGNRVVIETDTQDKGVGATAQEALQNMEDTSNGIIYLDTADYLLVTESVLPYVEQLHQYLKDNVKICQQTEPINTKLAAQYLSVHEDLPRLKAWEEGVELPVLEAIEEKKILIEKSKNNA